jgi:hypothetical protein
MNVCVRVCVSGLTGKLSGRGRQKKRVSSSSKPLCFRPLYPKIVTKGCGRGETRGRRGWGWMRSKGRRERRGRKERKGGGRGRGMRQTGMA